MLQFLNDNKHQLMLNIISQLDVPYIYQNRAKSAHSFQSGWVAAACNVPLARASRRRDMRAGLSSYSKSRQVTVLTEVNISIGQPEASHGRIVC